MRSLFFFFVLFFAVNTGRSQLNGTYTIGGTTPSYTSITSAVNDLIAQGVSGPVTFNIRSGIYNEHVIIPQITGASQTNNIVFQSEALDSSLVRWEFNNTVLADNYVCKLNGADYISLRHLTLARDLSSSQGCRTVIFENGANNNRVEHCRLIGRLSSSNEYSVVYSPNTIDTANYIGYNKILGGYTSIGLTGLNNTNLESGIVIEYNQGSGSLYSVKISYVNQFKIVQNTFVGPMDIEYFNGKSKFINNAVSNGGVDITDHLTTSMDSLMVFGNMISGTTSRALYLFNCPNAYVFHNTLNTNLSSSGGGGVFHSQNCNVSFANNIAQTTSNGYAAYFQNTNISSDYNIYRSTSTSNLIWRTLSYANLSTWQTATPYDDHSFQSVTNFIGTNDLHIFADIEASNNALPLGIGKDLDGEIRSGTPDIGADEFDNPDNETGVVKLMNIPTQICSGTVPIIAAVRNYGDINMTSVTVNWSVNGVVQPVVNWTGSILPGDSAFVTLSNFYFAPSSTYNFVVWTTSPNGQVDAVPSNDSYTNTPVYTMMQGSYTVGGVSPDYPTINACISALIQRGVCGPVVFNIRPGIYNEYLNFDGNSMNGLSWTNTVTFQSESLDSTSVEINYTNTSNSPLWMIDTWRAKHLIFRYMTFSRTPYSGWTNPYNSMYFDMADHITIENCVFRSPVNLLGKGITFTRSSNIKVHNCVFKSMYSGIHIEGDPNSINTHENVSVQNNQFFNLREKALMVYSIQDSVEIKNNYFTNDSLVLTDGLTTGTTALVATLCGGVVEIMNNRIEGRYGEEAMHVSCMNGTSSYKAKVYNNFISVACGFASGGGGQGTIALQTYTNNYVDFQYNTIHMYATPWSANDKYCRAAVQIRPIPASQNIRFRNNIIQADSLQEFFAFPGNWNTAVFSDFDHNNYYRTGEYEAPMTMAGGWPGNWNANSDSINPLFHTKKDLHVLNPQLAMGIAVPAPAVPNDIDGDLRNHPTVGADEGNFDPINIGSVQTKVESDCDSAKVFAKVFNYCLDTITSFKLGSVSNGASSPLYDWSGVLYPGDTTAWIQIGGFIQTNGQVYQVKTLTSLPNILADQFIPNDTSLVIYTAVVNTDTINLGNDLTGCAFDSVLLSCNSPGIFSGLVWSTSETSNSIYVNSSGTYTLTGTNVSGCISTDTVVVQLSTPLAISLTQLGDTLLTSVSTGVIAWYSNNILLAGETDTILELTGFGAFYSTLTDSIGCISYSDTLQIENFRDAGVQNIHFDHECATTTILVDVKNFGTQNISSLEFELMVDGVTVNTPAWTGVLASGDTLEGFVLTTVPHTFGQIHTINVTTELPNNDIDLFSLNDQLSATYHLQQSHFDLGPDTVVCIGNSIQLYPSDSLNFYGFNWSTGETNAVITVTQEGLFILEAIDSFGCVSTDSIEVMVGGDVEPVISFSNGTLYSSMSNGNQWHLNTNPISNATAASFVPTQNGNYTVVYTDEYGCEASSAVYVISTAGVIENEQTFSIYPNPASDFLNIVSNKTETVNYRITDVSGKLVQTGEISSNANVISLNNLQSGTYYITLSGSNSTLRFIK